MQSPVVSIIGRESLEVIGNNNPRQITATPTSRRRTEFGL